MLNWRLIVCDVWSERLIHSSISFKERRHLLCLKQPSYYCDNQDILPLSPYTQPFSLEMRDWGKRVVKIEREEDMTFDWSTTLSFTVLYLSTIVQFRHPSLFEVEEVRLWGKRVYSVTFTDFHLNFWQKCYKTWRTELCCLCISR